MTDTPKMRVMTYGISDRKSAEEFLLRTCDQIRGMSGLISVQTGITDDSFTVIYIFRNQKSLDSFKENSTVEKIISECLNAKWFKGLDSVQETILDYIFY